MQFKSYLYAAFDTLTGRFHDIVQGDTPAHGIRNLLLSMKVPLKDTELYCLGEITSDYPDDIEKVPISSLDIVYYPKPKLCSWKNYSLPETVADAISPLGAAAKIAEVRSREHRQDFYNKE